MKRFEGFMNGINLGGWISQYDRPDKEHFDTFITKEDLRRIASMGFDHVRVPVDYPVLQDEDGGYREWGFRYLDSCLEWCADLGLNMLIDLHECYGYSFDPLKKDMDRRRFFYDEALQDRFLKLWVRIAERFGRHSGRVAFEPLNEVVHPDVAEAWNRLAGKWIGTVREYAPDTFLVIGGVRYNSVTSVPLLVLPADERVVYNFHCYEPLIFTHQGAYWVQNMPADYRIGYPRSLEEYRQESGKLQRELAGAVMIPGISEPGPAFFEDFFRPAVEKAEKDGAALYCGEYGVIDRAAGEDKERWLRDIREAFDKYGIGRALWNYKEKDFGI